MRRRLHYDLIERLVRHGDDCIYITFDFLSVRIFQFYALYGLCLFFEDTNKINRLLLNVKISGKLSVFQILAFDYNVVVFFQRFEIMNKLHFLLIIVVVL